ncbi:hypothetical protein Taro_019796 [Colocasia esculenta]|uniref:Uncharacterized protein n=1 Tax=Colocasia esculenta TaxID=4460 RepID=A0A843V0B1_COLES|nr:hypothetical protein [Colocasia esculenta]
MATISDNLSFARAAYCSSCSGGISTAGSGRAPPVVATKWASLPLPSVTRRVPSAAAACGDGIRRPMSGRSLIRQQRARYLQLVPAVSNVDAAPVEEQMEAEIARGYTMAQFCDKMIQVFLYEKPQSKDWRKLLVFRDEWTKYKQNFYQQLQVRADMEKDMTMRQKLLSLSRKIKKIDDEIEGHTDLLKEIQQNPTDLNAVVAKRRKEFTGEFFRHINALSETYDSVEDRDVSAYDNAVQSLDMLETAQSKFDNILDSSSLEEACEKIQSLAKAKELDSSLILLINRAWAVAKESPTMSNEVKDIMHHIYKAAKRSLRSIAPPEIKLLKYLLNIIDPEERFSALATAFSPGDEREAKDVDSIYTTPKELHKWIKIMLDAYQLNKEETDMRDARNMTHPVVIQRLFILKETIEGEYLKRQADTEEETESKE